MKKIFAMFAIAALAFAVGCGPETKKNVIERKPDGGTKVDVDVKPGEEAEVKVDDKGASVEIKPEEKPAEPEVKPEEKPAEEKPADEKPAEEKPAEEKPAEEKPAAEAPKAEDK